MKYWKSSPINEVIGFVTCSCLLTCILIWPTHRYTPLRFGGCDPVADEVKVCNARHRRLRQAVYRNELEQPQ